MNALSEKGIAVGRARIMMSLVALAALVLTLCLPRSAMALPGAWGNTNSMHDQRTWFSATLLLDGKVLVAGGLDYSGSGSSSELDKSEIYDTATGTWTLTGNLGKTRYDHQAALLSNGRVLVLGGYISGGYTAQPEELYNPADGTWSVTGSLVTRRFVGHTATVIPDGRVLTAGGLGGEVSSLHVLNNAEIYDPTSGLWTSTGSMNAPRWHHTATVLSDGKVLVVGGKDDTGGLVATTELYYAASGTWSPSGSLNAPRFDHTATLLHDGRVLVVGGRTGSGYVTSAEIYDPATGSFSIIAQSKSGRCDHTATLLDNGKVLLAGGSVNTPPMGNCELYDPAAGSWNFTGTMSDNGRPNHRAVRLRDGKVLAMGGDYALESFESAELYEPEPPPAVKLPSLMAFYPFDGNPQDAGGNNFHGTPTGSPQVVAGYQGQAYSFDGATDYITTPVKIDPGRFPNLTMGCWAKVGSTWPLQTLLTHDNGEFDRSVGIDFRGACFGWSAFCGPTAQVLGAMQGYMNTWTFVAVVYDQAAQSVILQVDNQTITKTGATLGPGENHFFIGANPIFNTFFTGVIDNVFVFANALTEQQLAYIRYGGAPAILTAPRWHGGSLAPVTILLLD